MSTDASQSQGGADAPASVNNPRSAAAAATAAELGGRILALLQALPLLQELLDCFAGYLQ